MTDLKEPPVEWCPAGGTLFNCEGYEGYDPMRHEWFENEDYFVCPTCATEVDKQQ